MKKFLGVSLAIYCSFISLCVYANDKFEIIPDLPEYLSNSAQASSISNTNEANTLVQQSVGHEPNLVSIFFSLVFVILLIYATGIIYTKLNKLGLNTLKKQMGESNTSKVSVISTTALGSNKTLHVVELDGKRMLIGASSASIHLIKDLGTYNDNNEKEDIEYSNIEIPNIRIPKIEIPRIEFPGFTKVLSKNYKNEQNESNEIFNTNVEENIEENTNDDFEISDISVVDDNPDQIIDNLFKDSKQEENAVVNEDTDTDTKIEHQVDPDEYLIYKKYLV